MRYRLSASLVSGTVLVAGCCLAFGAPAAGAATAASQHAAAAAAARGQKLIVTFRYAQIQAAARRMPADTAQQRQARASGQLSGPQAATFLRVTARGYAAEKHTVLARQRGVRLLRDYPLLPTALVRASANAAARLAADPLVLSVTPDATVRLAGQARSAAVSPDSAPADLKLIDDVKAKAAGDLGEGTVVAILDNGTNYKNHAFGKCKVGAKGCRVLAYKDFAAPPKKGLSFNGHGTNVAGQVLKVAPDAKLVIGNVFHPGDTASRADIVSGLDWVLSQQLSHATDYTFRAVSLSLGESAHDTSSCPDSYAEPDFSQLAAVGIQPVVAAGNNAYVSGKYVNGVENPACAPDALAVGAVYDKNIKKAAWADCTDKTTAADKVTCFSQGGPLVGVLAPGVGETAAGITFSGTSQATPLVSGAVAALGSGAAGTSSAEIVSTIESTGHQVTDSRTGTKVPRLDVYAAEKALAREAVGGVIIKTSKVGLGVMQWGDLNVAGQVPSAEGTTAYGLRYLPTNNDFTGPGCLCEGWGAAATASGADGYADQAEGIGGLRLVSFTHTADSAKSVVSIGKSFRVTHAYSPVSGVPDLIKDKVTIKNVSRHALHGVKYRRLVDWDMEPTAFNEYVTIEGFKNSAKLTATTNDGFDSANPLSALDNLGATGNFVRFGPLDQGAQFDFTFGTLKAGKSITFTEYYGAAASQAGAYKDLAKVKAQAYSLGEPSSSTNGTPNTAILAFTGIGGKALKYPPK